MITAYWSDVPLESCLTISLHAGAPDAIGIFAGLEVQLLGARETVERADDGAEAEIILDGAGFLQLAAIAVCTVAPLSMTMMRAPPSAVAGPSFV